MVLVYRIDAGKETNIHGRELTEKDAKSPSMDNEIIR